MPRSVAPIAATLVLSIASVGCTGTPGATQTSTTSSGPAASASAASPISAEPTLATAPASTLPTGVVAEIRVGEGPGYAAVAAGSVWVGNHRSDSISRIDPLTDSVTATVSVPGLPTGITAGFGSIWTFTVDDRAVQRVDIATEKVVATIPVDAPAGSITGFVEAEGAMWLAPEGGRLIRIDPKDNTATDVLGLDTDCPGSLAAAEGSLWHVPLCGAPVVLRIDPADAKVVAKIEVPDASHAVWGGLDRVWAVSRWGDLAEIDPAANKMIRSESVGLAAEQVQTGLGAVWVRVDDRTLVAIEPRDLSIRATYALPPAQIPGGGIAVSDDAVWAANFTAGTVWRIQPER